MNLFISIGVWALGLIFMGSNILAVAKSDMEAIKSMSGCFAVTFQYQETETIEGVQGSNPYQARALEYIDFEEQDDGTLSLQHILKVAPGIFIKHWRQDWTREEDSFLKFMGGSHWERVGGAGGDVWLQKVYSVDDTPRYQCEGSWQSKDKIPHWFCRGWAPLPRREYSKRNDYNVMDRGNLLQVSPQSWNHIQANQKLVVENGVQIVSLGREVGLNSYVRVDDAKCNGAAAFWKGARQGVWRHIKEVIDGELDSLEVVHLVEKRDLTKKLNRLARSYMAKAPLSADDVESLRKEVGLALDNHLD